MVQRPSAFCLNHGVGNHIDYEAICRREVSSMQRASRFFANASDSLTEAEKAQT